MHVVTSSGLRLGTNILRPLLRTEIAHDYNFILGHVVYKVLLYLLLFIFFLNFHQSHVCKNITCSQYFWHLRFLKQKLRQFCSH